MPGLQIKTGEGTSKKAHYSMQAIFHQERGYPLTIVRCNQALTAKSVMKTIHAQNVLAEEHNANSDRLARKSYRSLNCASQIPG